MLTGRASGARRHASLPPADHQRAKSAALVTRGAPSNVMANAVLLARQRENPMGRWLCYKQRPLVLICTLVGQF